MIWGKLLLTGFITIVVYSAGQNDSIILVVGIWAFAMWFVWRSV